MLFWREEATYILKADKDSNPDRLILATSDVLTRKKNSKHQRNACHYSCFRGIDMAKPNNYYFILLRNANKSIIDELQVNLSLITLTYVSFCSYKNLQRGS